MSFSENFAQTLEIKEPDEDVPIPLPPSHPSSDFTSHTSSEVEVQVLQSGTVGLTSTLTTIPLPRRGRGKGRRGLKTTDEQPNMSYSVYEEQNVVSDGEFEIPPVVDDQGSEVMIAESGFISVGSNTESPSQVEASQAAQNLAFLATHVTSVADSDCQPQPPDHSDDLVCDVAVTTSPSTVTVDVDSAAISNTEPNVSSPENVSSEILAVAEVMSSIPESDTILTASSSVHSVQDLVIAGVSSQSSMEDETPDHVELSSMRTEPEAVRRSRRKVTQVRRLVSEEYNPPPPEKQGPRTPKRTSAKMRSV